MKIHARSISVLLLSLALCMPCLAAARDTFENWSAKMEKAVARGDVALITAMLKDEDQNGSPELHYGWAQNCARASGNPQVIRAVALLILDNANFWRNTRSQRELLIQPGLAYQCMQDLEKLGIKVKGGPNFSDAYNQLLDPTVRQRFIAELKALPASALTVVPPSPPNPISASTPARAPVASALARLWLAGVLAVAAGFALGWRFLRRK